MQSNASVSPLAGLYQLLCSVGTWFLCACALASDTAQKTDSGIPVPPNILIIVADDLGFSDVGAFGGHDIDTPNLDDLANQGLRLSNFHTLPTCAPTRAVLLTGVDNHIAGIGSQVISEKQAGQLGYEGFLNDRVITLAELLQDNGYRTYHSGKWHLGALPERGPQTRGFADSFALLPGGASHFADARPLHPTEPTVYVRNGSLVHELPSDFYSTKYYTDQMIEWLERDKNSTRPFFAYLAYTAPHDPLHAPADYIAKYRGVYDEGYEVLRQRRFEALQQAGLIPQEETMPPWPWYIKRWETLTEQEKVISRRDMEIYAAMIDYMDEQIGRLLSLLDSQGKLDSTLVVFMSDNGANGAPAKIYPSHTLDYHQTFDNRLANRGALGSFVSTGPGWALASSGGLSHFKYFLNEGGIRTAAMIKPIGSEWTGKVSSTFVHVRDILPTILDMAHIVHPAEKNSRLASPIGRSLLPLLRGEPEELMPALPIGYEVHGARAYIEGDWKAIYNPVGLGSGQWQLFNLAEDPTEQHDVSRAHPLRLKNMRLAHAQYERDNNVVYSPPKPVVKAQTAYRILLIASAVLIVWFHLLRQPLPGTWQWGLVLGLAKIGLLGMSLSSWRDAAVGLLLIVTCLEIFVDQRKRLRWKLLLRSSLLILVLTATLLLAQGFGLILFLKDY